MRPCFLQHRFLAGSKIQVRSLAECSLRKIGLSGKIVLSAMLKIITYTQNIYLQVLPYLLYSHRMDLMTHFKINIIIKLHFVYPDQYKQTHTNCSNCYIVFNRSVTTNPTVLKIEISTPPTISSAVIFLYRYLVHFCSHNPYYSGEKTNLFLAMFVTNAPAVSMFEATDNICLSSNQSFRCRTWFHCRLIDRFLSDVAFPLDLKNICIQVCCVALVVEASLLLKSIV